MIAVLDEYSRFVVHHELRATMTEHDVEVVVQRALERFPKEHPRVITDNRAQFASRDFKKFLAVMQLQYVRASPCHPHFNGKTEYYGFLPLPTAPPPQSHTLGPRWP